MIHFIRRDYTTWSCLLNFSTLSRIQVYKVNLKAINAAGKSRFIRGLVVIGSQ